MTASVPNHVWIFGGPRRPVDHHGLVRATPSPLQLPPRRPVLLQEARPAAVAGTRTLGDELLRHGLQEWGGIRVAAPYGADHQPLAEAVAAHRDWSGADADLPIVPTRERRQLADAVRQLVVPGTLAAVLSGAVHRQNLAGVHNLGLGFLAQVDGLGVHVLRDAASPFAVEHAGLAAGPRHAAAADRIVEDLQAACLRHVPRQLILLVDLDELQLFGPDALLLAAALRFVQTLWTQPVAILHSVRALDPALEDEMGRLTKRLGSSLHRWR